VTKTKKPLAVIAVFGNLVVLAHSRSQTKWVGMVIGIKSDKIAPTRRYTQRPIRAFEIS